MDGSHHAWFGPDRANACLMNMVDDVFCFEENRVVQNDWTIRHQNRYYQILKDNTALPKPKDKILVRTHLDERMQLLHRGKPLAFRSISPKQLHHQRRLHENDPEPAATPKARPTKKPAQNHPWRQARTLMAAEKQRST